MPRLPDTVKWRDVSAGNVQKVSSDITIPNSVPFSLNVLFDDVLGEAVSRPGTALISSPASGNCLGLFQHLDTTSASDILFAGFNDSIYNGVSGALSLALGAASQDATQRFATFLNATLMLNGVVARAYTASGGWVSGGGVLDVGNVPSGAKNPIEFKDRMYCTVNDTIYYTNTPTGGAVSWTAAGSGSLKAEQEDGGGTLQALSKVPGYLLIFKQRSLKRWNFDSTFPEDLINIGTQSAESVVRARSKCFFFYGPHGFYETNGSYPKLISRPIQRIIDAIPASSYGSIAGWSDNDAIYWSVGDVTVDFDRGYTETYTNVVVRMHIDTQQWSVHKYAHGVKRLHQYITNSSVLIAVGDASGRVLQINSGNTDYDGSAITYILQSPEFDFKAREKKKTLSEKIYVHSDGTRGALLLARLDYGEWKEVGSLKDIVTEVQIKTLTAHVFEFRLTDSITGAPVKLRGLDFPNVDVLLS